MADAQAYGLPAEAGVPSAGSDHMKDASHSTHTLPHTTHARAHPCTRAHLPSARSDPPNPLRPDDRLREEESEKAPFDSFEQGGRMRSGASGRLVSQQLL